MFINDIIRYLIELTVKYQDETQVIIRVYIMLHYKFQSLLVLKI